MDARHRGASCTSCEAVSGLSAAQLDTPYRDGGWTVRQVVHHLADSHMNAFIRFKLALTERHARRSSPTTRRRGPLSPTSRARTSSCRCCCWQGLHARWSALLAGLTPEQLDRTFLHPESGVAEARPHPADLRVALPPPCRAHHRPSREKRLVEPPGENCSPRGGARRPGDPAHAGLRNPCGRRLRAAVEHGRTVREADLLEPLRHRRDPQPDRRAGDPRVPPQAALHLVLRPDRGGGVLRGVHDRVRSANKLTTAANAILLQYTAPLYAAVLGWIFLKEKDAGPGLGDDGRGHRRHGPLFHGLPDAGRNAGQPAGDRQRDVLRRGDGGLPSAEGRLVPGIHPPQPRHHARRVHPVSLAVPAHPRRVGRARLPRDLPDRPLVDPADLRREARDAPCSHFSPPCSSRSSTRSGSSWYSANARARAPWSAGPIILVAVTLRSVLSLRSAMRPAAAG